MKKALLLSIFSVAFYFSSSAQSRPTISAAAAAAADTTVKITQKIPQGYLESFFDNEAWKRAYDYAKKHGEGNLDYLYRRPGKLEQEYDTYREFPRDYDEDFHQRERLDHNTYKEPHRNFDDDKPDKPSRDYNSTKY